MRGLWMTAVALLFATPGSLAQPIERVVTPTEEIRIIENAAASCLAEPQVTDRCRFLMYRFAVLNARARELTVAERYARKLAETADPASPAEQLRAVWLLGDILRDLNRFDEAETYYRARLQLVLATLPQDAERVLNAHDALAANLQHQGKVEAAEAQFRAAVAWAEQGFPSGHLAIARSYSNLAVHLLQLMRPIEAETLFRQAFAVVTRTEPDGAIAARLLSNLAATAAMLGRAGEAEQLQRKSIAIIEKLYPAGHTAVAEGYRGLAALLESQAQFQEAERLARRALAIYTAALPPDAAFLQIPYETLAQILDRKGAPGEAEALYRKARAAASALPTGHRERIKADAQLARHLTERGAMLPESRTLNRDAAVWATARLFSYVGFTEAAKVEMRTYRSLFQGVLKTNWLLSQRIR